MQRGRPRARVGVWELPPTACAGSCEGSIPGPPSPSCEASRAWVTEGPTGSGPPWSQDQHWAWPAGGAQLMSASPGLSLETPEGNCEFGEEGFRTSITRASNGSWRRMEPFPAPVSPGRVIGGLGSTVWGVCRVPKARMVPPLGAPLVCRWPPRTLDPVGTPWRPYKKLLLLLL